MANIDKEELLSNVKEDLAITDLLQDSVLRRLMEKVTANFKFKYNQDEIEKKFGFIIEDCTIKRFNRRKAEGAKKRTQEGFSIEYDDKAEFDEWDEDIRSALGEDEEIKPSKGRMGRMIILP